MPVVIDTSALYALVDRGERQHASVAAALSSEREAVVLPQTVLTESCYLIWSRLGPVVEQEFLRGLLDSDWRAEAMTAADLERTVELLATYADADLGFVDASLVAIAERLGARRLYTLDRRDFRLVRPRHTQAFDIRP
ncbi:PIN domain-containing protein [soil metagenome]